MAFNLSDGLANKEDHSNKDGKDSRSRSKDGEERIKVPRDFKMVFSKVEQSLGVFSERPRGYIVNVEFLPFEQTILLTKKTLKHKHKLNFMI